MAYDNFFRSNLLIVGLQRTPYVASREQSLSLVAPLWEAALLTAAYQEPRGRQGRLSGPAMRTFPVLASLSRPFGGSKRTVPLAPERRQGLSGRSRRSGPHASRSAPMARRMLIDASHPEETRVVVVDGTKLTEFDFETASRKPLKGNIYLAK